MSVPWMIHDGPAFRNPYQPLHGCLWCYRQEAKADILCNLLPTLELRINHPHRLEKGLIMPQVQVRSVVAKSVIAPGSSGKEKEMLE